MNNNIADRTKKVMSAVFEIPVEEVNNDSSPDTIESWDSLKKMNMVVAFEEEFSIQFSDVEIVEMLNMKLIATILKEKSVN